MKRLLLLVPLALVGAVACVPSNTPPGDLIGNFTFDTTLPLTADGGLTPEDQAAFSDCIPTLSEVVPSNFTFDAVLSTDGGTGFFTYGGKSRDGVFDGQFLVGSLREERRFTACTCKGNGKVYVDETIRFAVLSSSQAAALQAAGVPCSANLLDGGVPLNPAAGIVPPSRNSSGYDAVWACGELVDVVEPDPPSDAGVCTCTGQDAGWTCAINYPVTGTRKGI